MFGFFRSRKPPLRGLEVEPAGENDTGPCSCCGGTSRCVWGFVHSGVGPLAAYFVHWTVGQTSDHGANIDLILGRWGEGTTAADRFVVAMEFRRLDTGPAFMVTDAGRRPAVVDGSLAGKGLARSEVVGPPTAEQAFAIVDALLLQDRRIAELSGG